MAEEITDVFEVTQISEMASGVNTLVPLTPEQIEEIVGNDPDPKFATYIIEGGWSKSRRYYGPQVLQAISEQINNSNDVVGYQGHISPDRIAYDFPDIQFRWVKSKVQAGGEKVKLFVKAYLMPGSNARSYAERGLKVPISISGSADQRPIRGGVEVSNFDLESIDMARPRKAGMGGKLVGVTSEMEEGSKSVDAKDIAALSEEELRTHNPLLVKEIEEKTKKPLSDKITEMEEKQESTDENVATLAKIREALGIKEDADVLEVINATLKELRASSVKVREGILDSVLKSRFKDEAHRKLVRRVLATEMENLELPDGDDDGAKVKITEIVNRTIDEDEDLKEIASEMEDGGGANSDGGSKETDRASGNKRELKPGYENDNVRVRAAV